MRPAVVALIIGPVLSLARGMHWTMLVVIAARGPRRLVAGLVADLGARRRSPVGHRVGTRNR